MNIFINITYQMIYIFLVQRFGGSNHIFFRQTPKSYHIWHTILPQHIPFRVPQGSILFAILLSLYTTSLSQVITNHNLSHHLYADDTQVYIFTIKCKRILSY